MPLHPHLDNNGGKGAFIGEAGVSATTLGVEGDGWLGVEEVLPGLVPMLHKGGTSMRPMTEGHTSDRRCLGQISLGVDIGGCKKRR
jgi:hypothetical protein